MSKKVQTAIIKELAFLRKNTSEVAYQKDTHFTIIDATALFTNRSASTLMMNNPGYIKIIDINKRSIN